MEYTHMAFIDPVDDLTSMISIDQWSPMIQMSIYYLFIKKTQKEQVVTIISKASHRKVKTDG